MSEHGVGGEPDGQANHRGPVRGVRPHRRHVVGSVLAAKLAFVVLIVVLPSGLAVGLGAAHGIAALVVFVAVSVVVFARHRSVRRTARAKEGNGA